MSTLRLNVHRRAIVLVGVMVALLITMGIMTSVVRSVVAESRYLREEERNAQADWLANAGVERAAAALAADPEYRGETWEAPAEVIAGSARAAIEITVETEDDGASRVKVAARYPADAEFSAIGRKTVKVAVDNSN